MNQIKFNELPLEDKALIINEFGQLLDSTEYYNYWVHLYAMHSNFFEVYYNVSIRQIEQIRMIKYADLDKHLHKIIIKNLKS